VGAEGASGELRNKHFFEIVKHRGFFKAVGVQGALTGTPVDIGIIDDPFKDRMQANSEATRNSVWEWYQDVFLTRLHNDSKQLLLFTRWHEDDIAGRLLDPKNKYYDEQEASEWTVIALPALKEATKPIKQAITVADPREIDEALWESRHSREKYLKRKRINPTGFTSLDQQRPSAAEGNKIRREWLQVINKSELPFNPNSIACDYFIDGAFTEKTKNDETGLLSCYFHKETQNLYIFNCSGVRKELYELLKYFKGYAINNGYNAKSSVYIELKASGHPLKSMLSKVEYGAFNTRPVNSKVEALGKFNRVENSEPTLASGKVFLIKGVWNQEFIDQCAAFPNGTHDDMVDVLCYAIHKYYIKKSDSGVSYEM
jgi:predicted phage terminase large subunit-like protein